MKSFTLQAKAIADPTRIRVLKLLENGELCVCEIMLVLGLGQSTASKHLGILKAAGLVESRKNGTWSYYQRAGNGLPAVGDYLDFMASHLNDDKVIKEDRKALLRVQRTRCGSRGILWPRTSAERAGKGG